MITLQYEFPGFRCRDHVLDVPLNHADPAGESIEVFGREVVRPDKDARDLPWLLFLQGGPGHRSDRPNPDHAWLPRALEEFRVLLLDPRGTGRSALVNRQTLTSRGNAVEQAEYLTHFRADSIVRDAEAFRRELVGEDGDWSILGQSFGGFCAVTYLSFAPEHLREVLIAGGLPSITASAEDVYRAAYPRVRMKNRQFLSRYPEDAVALNRLADVLNTEKILLPNGDRLTVERLQTLGLELGMASRFDSLHFLLEEAFLPGGSLELSDTFLHEVHRLTSFVSQPLFAVMHEAIYGQGAATGWAADRVRHEFPEFDPAPDSGQLLLTGEMIYPWLFEQDSHLSPLFPAAELIAERADWSALYDADVLAANKVPVAAAVYHDDMYVDREMSLQTASQIQGCRTLVTNEYEHDGLRHGVLDILLRMARSLA